MSRDVALAALQRILRDISPAEDSTFDLGLEYLADAADRLPLPFMVFFALLLGTDCKFVSRPIEKTAWAISLRFKGRLFQLEHGKFGMRLATVNAELDAITEDLIAVIKKAFPLADRILQSDVDEQVEKGNVTVRNLHHLLHSRYQFFREKAEKVFRQPRPDVGLAIAGALKDGKAHSVDIFKTRREGFFYGTAAIDAFFSWLEHVLVLMTAFAGYDPAVDDLRRLIGLPWRDKLKRTWDISGDTEAKGMYDALLGVKERFRNWASHGGFGKGDESLLVHMPYVGAVPARMSRFTDGSHYGVFPLEDSSFADACALFDRVEAYLREGPTHYGVRFAESGLDVAFDAASRMEYQSAMSSDELFEELIGRLAYFSDTAANMDW